MGSFWKKEAGELARKAVNDVIKKNFKHALDVLGNAFDFLKGTDKGELVGSVLLLGLIVFFIVYVTQAKESHGQPEKKS